MKCEILYEDGEILVVRKPAGFATQSGSVSQPDVVSELKGYLKGFQKDSQNSRLSARDPYLGVIHRLDQPVEGLLVFAKTPKAAADLTKQLSAGILNKNYYAVVCGKVMPPAGELEDFLWKDTGNVARVVTGRENEFPQAKRAKLSYMVLGGTELTRSESGEKVSCSLLDIHIETGRFHQIRAQLSHAGWPILGDRKYGSELSILMSGQYRIDSTLLCAYEIRLRHPETGEERSWKILPEAKAFTIIKA